MATLAEIVRKETNRILDSNKLADLVYGKVVSVDPLKVSIDERFEIEKEFIHFNPQVKGIELKAGDILTMVRYKKGQLYYVVEINGEVSNSGSYGCNIDGGEPGTNYGGMDPINGGGVENGS